MEEPLSLRTVDNVADGLETSTADGPLARIQFVRLAVKPTQDQVTRRVEDRVHRCGEEGQRARADGGIH